MLKALLLMTIFWVQLKASTRDIAWENTKWIWNFGIIHRCDKGPKETPWKAFEEDGFFDESAYQGIKEGDFVWVRCRHLPDFYKRILSTINHSFVLIVADGDESSGPSDEKDLTIDFC